MNEFQQQDYGSARLSADNIKTSADSVKIEPIRGCTRGCRFCMHGFISRPIRERRVSNLSSVTISGVTSTGYDLIECESECLGDYSKLNPLLKEMKDIDRIEIPTQIICKGKLLFQN